MKLTVELTMMPAVSWPSGGRFDGSDGDADLDVCPTPNNVIVFSGEMAFQCWIMT